MTTLIRDPRSQFGRTVTALLGEDLSTALVWAEISGRYVISLNSILDMWRHVEATEPKVVYKAIERRDQPLRLSAHARVRRTIT